MSAPTSIAQYPQNQLQRPSIRMSVSGCLAVVSPGHKEVLGGQLEYSEIRFETSPTGQVIHRRLTRDVYEKTAQGQLVIPVGLVRRVHEFLTQSGLEVILEDHRRLERQNLQIDEEYALKANAAFADIVKRIHAHTEGVLIAPRGKSRNALIGTLCRLFLRARTFVACATRKQCKETASALGNYVGGDVDVVHGGTWQSPYRVVCGTYTSYDTSDPANWDLLIFEDGFEALGKKTHATRGQYGNHRAYAFIDPPGALSLKDQLTLEVLAGPVIYHAPSGKRRQPTAVEVGLVEIPLCYARRSKDARRQREELWADQVRNNMIVRIANAFAQRNPRPLWQAGLLLDCNAPFDQWNDRPVVSVVVESTRQAQHLAQSLTDWPVLHARPSKNNNKDVQTNSWTDWALPDKSIITITRAAAMKTFAADVIILAAGGPYPQLPHGIARTGRSVLVVDFADEGHHEAIKDFQQRRRVYAELGYSIISQPRLNK